MNADSKQTTRDMVTFWASSFDAMLQDFQAALLDPESTKQQKATAISKVAQLAILAFQWFNAGLSALSPSTEEKAECLKACERVKDMCEKHIDEIDRQLGDAEPQTLRSPKLLN